MVERAEVDVPCVSNRNPYFSRGLVTLDDQCKGVGAYGKTGAEGGNTGGRCWYIMPGLNLSI